MGTTPENYASKDTVATVPYIAHKIIISKYKRKEKYLKIALAISVAIGIISHLVVR